MIRKTVLLVAVALFVLSLSPAEAQIRDETVLTYEVLSQEWENLIAGVLDLSVEEAAAFWPLYREYSTAKGLLWEERIDVIAMFLAGYDTMGAEIARGLLRASFDIDEKMLAVERGYAEKFDDVLPLNKVVRLFQAENKLETTMMMELARDIPIAKQGLEVCWLVPDTEIGAWHLSKRNVAMERFADLIEEMYRES